MDEHLFAFFLVLVPLLGILAQWLAWRIRVPSILLLLGFGLGLGIWISPDGVLAQITGADPSVGPKILFPIVSLSVAIILFEGGLTLRWSQLGDAAGIVFRLIAMASIVTWVVTALLSHYLLGFSWPLAWLLGAILMVTGPTVVGPLLRQIRPNRRVSSVLQWEGILIDPVGAVAAVLVYEVIAHSHFSFADTSIIILQTLAIGCGLGGITAVLLVAALRNYLIPDFLHGVSFLVAALASFFLSNLMCEESGLVTVTVLGICLANQKYVSVEHVLEFKEHLRVLLISCLFIVLGARLQLSDLGEIGWMGIPFVIALVVIVRPLSVFVSTLGMKWDFPERLFVGLVAPRGIVAAAVASVFGLKLVALAEKMPEAAETFAKAELLAPVTFLVILGTVTLCGLGAGPLARKLSLADVSPQGILFAGAAGWVREVALTLQQLGFRVQLVDTNYSNVTASRMAGLDAKCGNILSEHVHEEQELAGIGRFLAATPSDEVNTLAAMEYTHVFSRANVYQLESKANHRGRWSIPEKRRARMLFDAEIYHSTLEEMFEQGAIVKATPITETFSMESFREIHGDDVVVLFAVDSERKLTIRTSGTNFEPAPGDTVIAIVPRRELQEPEETEESMSELI